MSPLCVVLLVVALVPTCSLGAAAGAYGRAQVPTLVRDLDDFYYFDGKPVRLDRATSELVMGVANGTEVSQLLRGVPVQATAGSRFSVRGRHFVVLTLDAAPAGPGPLAELRDAMRAKPGVWFTSPIYYYSSAQNRVVPTDELIVRTRATITPESIAGVLQAKGLRQISRLDGTTDQFLVRIESAKDADVLRVARELYETGLFQSAEPDFIRELRREG